MRIAAKILLLFLGLVFGSHSGRLIEREGITGQASLFLWLAVLLLTLGGFI